ncbi:SMC family ATPase [candidate division KSB1 bacterium]|nr:SMC family ATPase [candidate division KSB1 bacterium]RQW01648.1 MAG: SMC family ATPase [candidate division KSB1 bacterium]
MIIKSLKLHNYRRFEQLEIEFPENLIGIIGRNGAGKSTIIEAIGWALYGNRFVRSDKHDVRLQGTDDKAVCSAEIVFVYGGSEFRIERKLKGKNATVEAAVWRNGQAEAVAVQDAGVSEFIESLLQLDYRSFTTSVFAQQKELDKLSTLQPEQRRQAINRLINIDRIDRARERVRADRNEKQTTVKGQKAMLKDIDELNARKKRRMADHGEMKKQHAALRMHADERSKRLARARANLQAMTHVRDQFRAWEAQMTVLQSRLAENEKNHQRSRDDLAEIEKAEQELKGYSVLLSEMSSIKVELSRLDAESARHSRLQSRLAEKKTIQDVLDREQSNRRETESRAQDVQQLEKMYQELSLDIEQLERAIEDIQERSKKATGEKLAAESKGVDLRQKLAAIHKMGPDGSCPVCGQRLGDYYGDVIDDHEKQLAELRSLYSAGKQAEERADAERKDLQQKLAQRRSARDDLLVRLKSAQEAGELLGKIEQLIIGYEKQMSTIDAAIDAMGPVAYDEDQHRRLKARYEELLSLQQRAAKLEERIDRRQQVQAHIEAIVKELHAIGTEMTAAQTAQAALEFNEAIYEQEKQNVEKDEAEWNAAKDELAQAAQQVALIARDMEAITKEISEQKVLAGTIRAAEKEILYLNILDDYLGRFRLDLAGRIRPLIAQRASELLSLTTASRYAQLDLDQDYNIRVYDGNRVFPIERFSGGEQDLVNLCLRIAISQVVAERSGGAPINFIVLDEIFGSQDAERRDLILNALAQLSSQFRQIYIITHIESIRDMLPVLIHVELKDDRTSRATLL